MMISGMNARLNVLPDLITKVDKELDWFDKLIVERGDCLVANDFGRADLTAASILAPIARLQNEPIHSISAGIQWPQSLVPSLARWSKRPSLEWVKRIYASKRVC